MRLDSILPILGVAISFSPLLHAAPTVELSESLNFGVLAVRSNSFSSSLRLASSGAVVADGDLISVGGAERADVRLSGFPPGVLLTFEFDEGSLSEGGIGIPPFMSVSAFEAPEKLLTDASGSARFWLGGRLTTSGNGSAYRDAPYRGSTGVRVTYWSEGVGNYITHYDQINLSATVQSTLVLSETQALSFGTVAAFPTSTGIARLTLSPKGEVDTVLAGGARIVPLGGATPGVFVLSGAAPNYSVVITAPGGSIQLSHAVLGGNVPRFLARDFVTLPSGTALTDSNGELSISVGASLETELSSAAYAPGQYSGTFMLSVSY